MASVEQGGTITSVFAYADGLSADGYNTDNAMLYIYNSTSNEYRSNGTLQENDFVTQNYILQTYYVMRARDVDCVTITYRIWTVAGSPDTSGVFYSGIKCGASALEDITIVAKYQA